MTTLPPVDGFREGASSPAHRSIALPVVLAIGIGVGVMVPATPAGAVVLFDNLNQSETTNPFGPRVVFNSQWQAQSFSTTATDYVLTAITARIRGFTGISTGTFSYQIYSNNSGVPGSLIATAYTSSAKNPPLPNTTATNVAATGLSITLSPSTSYFLVIRGTGLDNFVQWSYVCPPPSLGCTGAGGSTYLQTTTAGSSWSTPSGQGAYTSMFRIDATSVPGPLPALGAAAAFGWSRRLRRRIGATEPKRRAWVWE